MTALYIRPGETPTVRPIVPDQRGTSDINLIRERHCAVSPGNIEPVQDAVDERATLQNGDS